MGYVDVAGVGFVLPDGRELFADVSFRVGEGAKVALVGPNGAGKTTLLRMVAGDLPVQSGTVARVRRAGRDAPVHRHDRRRPYRSHDLALSLGRAAAAGGRRRGWPRPAAGARTTCARRPSCVRRRARRTGARPAGTRPRCSSTRSRVAMLDMPWDEVRHRPVRTLSGGQQKRFALELLLRGTDEVLLLDEPDNFLDVPGKRWLEARLRESPQVGALRLARPGAAGTDRRPGGRGRGRQRVDASGRLRLLARGPGQPARAAGGEPPPLGRGAPEAARADADVQAEGGLQRRHGVAVPGRADPAAQVRGGRSAAAAAQGPVDADEPARRAHRQARGHLRASWSWRT